MYDAEALLNIHARAHESLRRLIVFCANLTDVELRQPLTGFGFSTAGPWLRGSIYLSRPSPGKYVGGPHCPSFLDSWSFFETFIVH